MDRDEELLSYHQDRLSPEARQDFEARLQREPDLAAELSVMRAVQSAFKDETAAESSGNWARLEAAIAANPRAANSNFAPWAELLRIAAAVVVSIGLWHALVVPQFGTNPAEFSPASAQAALPVLQVFFQPEAQLGDVTALLQSEGGVVVDGPSAIGLYRVAFETEDIRAAALEALRARGDLIADAMVE